MQIAELGSALAVPGHFWAGPRMAARGPRRATGACFLRPACVYAPQHADQAKGSPEIGAFRGQSACMTGRRGRGRPLVDGRLLGCLRVGVFDEKEGQSGRPEATALPVRAIKRLRPKDHPGEHRRLALRRQITAPPASAPPARPPRPQPLCATARRSSSDPVGRRRGRSPRRLAVHPRAPSPPAPAAIREKEISPGAACRCRCTMSTDREHA
jgi:hypothetical protein